MKDSSLGPFVDALASALIMMVLVAVFFLVQSITSIEKSAKLYTVGTLAEDKYSPIVFRRPLKVDIEKNELIYLLNFDIKPEDILAIRNKMIASEKEITVTFISGDSDKKTTVNMLRFLLQLDLPDDVNLNTIFVKTNSTISKITWEF